MPERDPPPPAEIPPVEVGLRDEIVETPIVLARYGPLTPTELAEIMGWTYEEAVNGLRFHASMGGVECQGKKCALTEKGWQTLNGATEWMEERDE